MRTAKHFALFCILCLFCQPILAQCKVRLAELPPFERAVVVVKYFEGLHNKPKDFPYVGYGHLYPNFNIIITFYCKWLKYNI